MSTQIHRYRVTQVDTLQIAVEPSKNVVRYHRVYAQPDPPNDVLPTVTLNGIPFEDDPTVGARFDLAIEWNKE